MSEWEDYESGPFCRHWGDPESCDEVCATCGHRCPRHNVERGNAYCFEDGCEYEEWKESNEPDPSPHHDSGGSGSY